MEDYIFQATGVQDLINWGRLLFALCAFNALISFLVLGIVIFKKNKK